MHLIGPVVEEDYNKALPALAGLAALAQEAAAVITRYNPLGAPLWSSVNSSAYASLLACTATLPLCALTWNSSPLCWAGLLPWRTGAGQLQEQLLVQVGTWPPCWDVSEQPFRKAHCGALAFKAALQATDL